MEVDLDDLESESDSQTQSKLNCIPGQYGSDFYTRRSSSYPDVVYLSEDEWENADIIRSTDKDKIRKSSRRRPRSARVRRPSARLSSSISSIGNDKNKDDSSHPTHSLQNQMKYIRERKFVQKEVDRESDMERTCVRVQKTEDREHEQDRIASKCCEKRLQKLYVAAFSFYAFSLSYFRPVQIITKVWILHTKEGNTGG